MPHLRMNRQQISKEITADNSFTFSKGKNVIKFSSDLSIYFNQQKIGQFHYIEPNQIIIDIDTQIYKCSSDKEVENIIRGIFNGN